MEMDNLLHVPAEARIVEIDERGRAVTFSHGNIVISGDEGPIDRIPILEIAAMVATRPGLSWSGPAMAALSERAAGIVICDANHGSRMLSWPISGRRWPQTIRAQMELDPPLGRQLLRSLAKVRDEQRESVVAAMGKGDVLRALRKAGEPAYAAGRSMRARKLADLEAQITRHYWSWLAGPGFRRDPKRAGANAVINFAQTMLRIESVRAIHRAGIHPSIGLGGNSRTRGLVDDVMLPYRPLVDLAAAILIATGCKGLDDIARDGLVRLFTAPMRGRRGVVQIRMGLEELAESLARSFESGDSRLEIRLPAIQDPSALYDRMMDAGESISGWG